MHVIFLLTTALLLSSCSGEFGTREAGALGGGAAGAGLGAIVGHATGHTGEGVAIGAAVGVLTGALIGNELAKREEGLQQRDAGIAAREAMLAENRRLLEELRQRGTDAYQSDRGVVVNLPDVLFDFDSANLTAAARLTVTEVAEVLRQSPQRLVSVEGHTDSVGTVPYNQKLSEDRARRVAEVLAEQGLSRSRLSSRGWGESRPVASNASAAGRSRNRRVEVIIENRQRP